MTTARPGFVLHHWFADTLPQLSYSWSADCQPVATEKTRPRPVVVNRSLAVELGIDPAWLETDDGIDFLLGRFLPETARPVAQAYAGHQFGRFVPLLGDGRAVLLGEIDTPDGQLADIHLKGSGRTPFARGGDGLAPLTPMLREYVISEAMHALGIPTSRSLAVIDPGWQVVRGTQQRAGVLVRTAPSHLRIGSFQYAAIKDMTQPDGHMVATLADAAIARHFPGLANPSAHCADTPTGSPRHTPEVYREFVRRVLDRQALLVALWTGAGFVHGVQNTDNVAIAGHTIDYGPCAFLDDHDKNAVFSSIDTHGRYAFGRQPSVACWNMARFAETLLPLVGDNFEKPVVGGLAHTWIMEELDRFEQHTAQAIDTVMARKIGCPHTSSDPAGSGRLPTAGPDADVVRLAAELDRLISIHHPDHNRTFDLLTGIAETNSTSTKDTDGSGRACRRMRGQLHELFNGGNAGAGEITALNKWLDDWLNRIPDPATMASANPVHIPRNHVVNQALEDADEADMAAFNRLCDAVTRPFDRQGKTDDSCRMPPPAGTPPCTTFCGT